MPHALLPDRAVISVIGADARAFLQNLVTCDLDPLAPGEAAFGALLTPQGKILFDFFVVCLDGESFYLDTDALQADALAKRLAMYKLRAKVAVIRTTLRVIAVWGSGVAPNGLCTFRDPRTADMGTRVIIDTDDKIEADSGDAAAYDAHRITQGVPQGGVDFIWGDAFPHETNMDLMHGVSFTKGCYVGQEVVSRTQHRGTARRRILRATFAGLPPAPGTEIHAGDLLLGAFGSAAEGHALAAVRTDRLAEAQAAGVTAKAGGVALNFAPSPVLSPSPAS